MEAPAVAASSPNLQVGYLFGKAWETFKQNMGISLLMFLLYSVLTNLGSGGSLVLNIAGILISGPVIAGTYNAFLRMLRGEKVPFVSMFDGFKEFVRAFCAFWLMILAVLGGLILLIVPGIIIALGLIPVMFLVLETDLGAVDTIKRAWAMTKGHKGSLFVLFLAIIGLNILGLLALVIGLIVTGTITLFIGAAVYDELAKASAPEPIPVAPPEATPIG